MRKTFYNTRLVANELDSTSLSLLSQMHQSVRNLFIHLNNERGYDIPEYLITAFENWHQETEVRLGMRPTGKHGKSVLIRVVNQEAKYAPLTVPSYMVNMTYYAKELSKYVNPRSVKEVVND